MKRKNRAWLAVLLTVLLMLVISACTGAAENAAPEPTEPAESGTAGPDAAPEQTQTEAPKSDGYEKFSRLEMGMTESGVNAILGEPVRVDKAYYYYNIMVNGQEMEIEVWIDMTSGQVIYINGDFYKDEYRAEFADSATDFSTVDDLDSGRLATYEDCAAAFKTPGYLITMDKDGMKRYLWVDENDGNLCVTFKADGSVRSYSGYC